jgi:hypothetical protein
MSQLPPENHCDNLQSARGNLDEVCENVSRHFEEIYPLPKKFIEQTAPAVDKYLREFSNPSTHNGNYFVFQAIMGFMQQFDDFALMTNKLFTDYKTNLDEYKAYNLRLSGLNKKNEDAMSNESAQKFEELTPELMELSNRMKAVKERSEEMVKRLEKIETRWNKIKTRLKQ